MVINQSQEGGILIWLQRKLDYFTKGLWCPFSSWPFHTTLQVKVVNGPGQQSTSIGTYLSLDSTGSVWTRAQDPPDTNSMMMGPSQTWTTTTISIILLFLICRYWAYGHYFPLGRATVSWRWIWRIQKQENFVRRNYNIIHRRFHFSLNNFLHRKLRIKFNLKEFQVFHIDKLNANFDQNIRKENNQVPDVDQLSQLEGGCGVWSTISTHTLINCMHVLIKNINLVYQESIEQKLRRRFSLEAALSKIIGPSMNGFV